MPRESESPRFVLILGGLFLISYAAYQVGSAWMAAFPPTLSTGAITQPYPAPDVVIPLVPYPEPQSTSIPAYPYPGLEPTESSAYPYPGLEPTESSAYPGLEPTDIPANPYPDIEPTATFAQSYPELEITNTPANVTPTLTPTMADVTPTQTETPTPDVSPTTTPTSLPTATPEDDAYPGPQPTITANNPYPGPEQTATATPDSNNPYPGPEQTETPSSPTPTTTFPEQHTPTPFPTQGLLPTLESTPTVITRLPSTETNIVSDGSVNQAIWLHNASNLALATSKGIFLVKTLGSEPQLLDAGAPIASIVRLPDGDRIAAGGLDSLIRIWDVVSGDFITYFRGHMLGVVNLSYSPVDRFLVSASDDATVRIWNDGGVPLHVLRGPITRIVDMAVSSNGQMVAAASSQNVHIWNPQTGELLHTISQPAGWFTAAAFSPNSQILTTAYDGRKLEIWDTATWKRKDIIPVSAPVQSLAYHPEGRLLAIAYQNGRIQIRDTFYRLLLADFAGHPQITSIAFSPYDDQLVTSSADGSIRLWDLTPLIIP